MYNFIQKIYTLTLFYKALYKAVQEGQYLNTESFGKRKQRK